MQTNVGSNKISLIFINRLHTFQIHSEHSSPPVLVHNAWIKKLGQENIIIWCKIFSSGWENLDDLNTPCVAVVWGQSVGVKCISAGKCSYWIILIQRAPGLRCCIKLWRIKCCKVQQRCREYLICRSWILEHMAHPFWDQIQLLKCEHFYHSILIVKSYLCGGFLLRILFQIVL